MSLLTFVKIETDSLLLAVFWPIDLLLSVERKKGLNPQVATIVLVPPQSLIHIKTDITT